MKKNVSLSGRILLPLQEGQRAVIQSGGSIIHTSLVVEIIEQNPDFAHFETMNSVYQVALAPVPIEAALPTPLAMCA